MNWDGLDGLGDASRWIRDDHGRDKVVIGIALFCMEPLRPQPVIASRRILLHAVRWTTWNAKDGRDYGEFKWMITWNVGCG
jgi:hypothetical protein